MPPRKRKEPKVISTIKTTYTVLKWFVEFASILQTLDWLIETIKRLLKQ